MRKVQVAYGRVDVELVLRCPRCKGTGEEFSGACPYCKGKGERAVGYTYWCSEQVEIGDIVLVPGNWRYPGPQEATVISLDSDWTEEADSIIRVLKND